MLSIGLMLAWQALSSLIVIPKFGPIKDIDLFFSVYITFAFVAGLFFDKYSQNALPEERIRIQNILFSALIGNTVIILMYLSYIGLPIPI